MADVAVLLVSVLEGVLVKRVVEILVDVVDDTVLLVNMVVERVWLVVDLVVVIVVDSEVLPVVNVAVLLVSVVDGVVLLVNRVVDGVWLGVDDDTVLVVDHVVLLVVDAVMLVVAVDVTLLLVDMVVDGVGLGIDDDVDIVEDCVALLVVMVVAMSVNNLLNVVIAAFVVVVVLVALELIPSIATVGRTKGSFIGKIVLKVVEVTVAVVAVLLETTVGKQLATEQGLLSITASTGQHGDPPHCRDKLADNFCQMPSQTPSTMAPFTMSYLWIKKVSIKMYSGIAGIITINVSSQKNLRY